MSAMAAGWSAEIGNGSRRGREDRRNRYSTDLPEDREGGTALAFRAAVRPRIEALEFGSGVRVLGRRLRRGAVGLGRHGKHDAAAHGESRRHREDAAREKRTVSFVRAERWQMSD